MRHTARYALLVLIALAGIVGLAVDAGTKEAPEERSFVGQASCTGCHAGAYGATSDYQGAAAFSQTLHQKIHLRPSPETVVIEKYFAGDSVLRYLTSLPIPGEDTLLIHLSKSADGREYFAQMRFSGPGGDSTPRMKIAYTYGGYGWIQRFLVEINGSFHVLPFQYVLPAYRERSDTSQTFVFLDLFRWFDTDPNTGLGRFFKFNSAQFHSVSWDRACSFCHVNGFGLATKIVPGPDTSFYASWVGRGEDSLLQDENIRIGCESCHGPGSEHVSNPTKTNIFSPGQLPRTREATDIKLDVCNACHTRVKSKLGLYTFPYDEAADRPWRPGELVKDYFRHPFNDAQFWPDRVTSFAHHQAGQDFWRGDPYEKHVFADGCWDCHAVHTNGGDGLPYQLKKNYYSMEDGVGCLECHGSSAPNRTPAMEDLSLTTTVDGRVVNAHTLHRVESSACVNCHFTKAATISFANLPRKPYFEFSQHDFRVVRPIATRQFAEGINKGMINTCAASCHRNGRGSRNTPDSLPEAPSFGITDRAIDFWREPTDLELADSLWFHYQRMYARYLSSVRDGDAIGTALAIVAIAPNPVATTTSIRYTLPRRADVRLEIHDVRGHLLRTLASAPHDAGTYIESWDTFDELGTPVPSGLYLVRLTASGRSAAATITVVR
jgi:hypothetical protein